MLSIRQNMFLFKNKQANKETKIDVDARNNVNTQS